MDTFPRFVTVGFVGARRLATSDSSGDETAREVVLRSRIGELLNRLQAGLGPGESLIAVSALAAGADTVFAEVVATRGIPHQVVLPQTPDVFFNEADFFRSATVLERSRRLCTSPNVINVRVASEAEDRATRFSECGFAIAHESDVLIGVVRPEEQGRTGGTRETLAYGLGLGLRVFEIALRDDLPYVETASQRAADHEIDREIFSWSIAPANDSPDALLAAIRTLASHKAKQDRRLFHSAAAAVLLTHAAATAVAAWELSKLWGGGHLTGVEAALLVLGLGVYFFLHHWKPQRGWVTGRLVAELTRSVVKIRGLPARLVYLWEFHIPGAGNLVRSLSILHLLREHQSPMPPAQFVSSYLKGRIDEQIEYFTDRARHARSWRTGLNAVFVTSSSVALITILTFTVLELCGRMPESTTNWERLIFRFVPVALPMIAAGAASWVSVLDLDRRVERYEGLVDFLQHQRDRIASAASPGILRRAIYRTEHGLLQEVVEWFAKHSHIRGH